MDGGWMNGTYRNVDRVWRTLPFLLTGQINKNIHYFSFYVDTVNVKLAGVCMCAATASVAATTTTVAVDIARSIYIIGSE